MKKEEFLFDGFCDQYKQDKLMDYLAKLQKYIDYPRIEIQDKVDKQGLMLCSELRLFASSPEEDLYAIRTYCDESEKEFVIDFMLREIGYQYLRRAYEYWKNKGM